MSDLDVGAQLDSAPQVDSEQARRARLTVARWATDAQDCRLLLEVLGLDAPMSGPETR